MSVVKHSSCSWLVDRGNIQQNYLRGFVHRSSLHLLLLHGIDVNLALGSTNARSVLLSNLLCDLGACGATPDGLKCVNPWTLAANLRGFGRPNVPPTISLSLAHATHQGPCRYWNASLGRAISSGGETNATNLAYRRQPVTWFAGPKIMVVRHCCIMSHSTRHAAFAVHALFGRHSGLCLDCFISTL